MRTWIVAAVTVTVVCWLAGPSLAGISGSAHDFGGSNWSDNQICLPCHTPHNAIIKDTNGDELPAPLWNHELSKATYTLYLDSSGNGVTGELDQYSKLCMSCHDGTVALDSFGGVSGNQYITRPQAILGTDLSNDHPIGEAAIWKGTYDPTAPKGSRWSGESTSQRFAEPARYGRRHAGAPDGGRPDGRGLHLLPRAAQSQEPGAHAVGEEQRSGHHGGRAGGQRQRVVPELPHEVESPASPAGLSGPAADGCDGLQVIRRVLSARLMT